MFTWGYTHLGFSGSNDRIARSSPTQVGSDTDWEYVSRGGTSNDGDHAFYTKTNGTMWASGSNNQGQLGQNNRTTCSSPVQVPGTTWGSQVTTNSTSSYAIKTDGTLWSWGYNSPSYGNLGHNNKTNYSSPVQVPGTTWSKISLMGSAVITTKTDGSMWNWGANSFGMLGIGNDTAYSSPKQVPGSTWGTYIDGGDQIAAAIKTNGTLWMWGNNGDAGQLGQNNRTNRNSPVQIPGTTWAQVACTRRSTIATKTDGTLWAWGQNDAGMLGLNDIADRSSPVQIPGTTWNTIVGGLAHFLATKTDGTLWSWGGNGQGQMGINAINNNGRSSPTQIPGTTWQTGDRKIGTTWLGSIATKAVG